jgi:hypothetical protein
MDTLPPPTPEEFANLEIFTIVMPEDGFYCYEYVEAMPVEPEPALTVRGAGPERVGAALRAAFVDDVLSGHYEYEGGFDALWDVATSMEGPAIVLMSGLGRFCGKVHYLITEEPPGKVFRIMYIYVQGDLRRAGLVGNALRFIAEISAVAAAAGCVGMVSMLPRSPLSGTLGRLPGIWYPVMPWRGELMESPIDWAQGTAEDPGSEDGRCYYIPLQPPAPGEGPGPRSPRAPP